MSRDLLAVKSRLCKYIWERGRAHAPVMDARCCGFAREFSVGWVNWSTSLAGRLVAAAKVGATWCVCMCVWKLGRMVGFLHVFKMFLKN